MLLLAGKNLLDGRHSFLLPYLFLGLNKKLNLRNKNFNQKYLSNFYLYFTVSYLLIFYLAHDKVGILHVLIQ